MSSVRVRYFLNKSAAKNCLKHLETCSPTCSFFVLGIFLPWSNFGFSSISHKNLLQSWITKGTAGSFHSLRPTCLRQTPSFRDFLFQRVLNLDVWRAFSKNTLEMQGVQSLDQPSSKKCGTQEPDVEPVQVMRSLVLHHSRIF